MPKCRSCKTNHPRPALTKLSRGKTGGRRRYWRCRDLVACSARRCEARLLDTGVQSGLLVGSFTQLLLQPQVRHLVQKRAIQRVLHDALFPGLLLRKKEKP